MESLLAGTIALLAVAMIVAIIARRLKLPYTVGLVLTGLALALARIRFGLELSHDFIFDLILPPLLFEAALNLPWRDLRRDLPPVLLMSFVGVALCVAVVAAGLVALLGWPILPALAFGSLVGATDPIAVIALLRESGVKGRLALLIESESLVNDGSAALMFGLVAAALAGSGVTPWLIVFKIVVVAFGGALAGLFCGGLAILIAGGTDDHLIETAITVVAAYGSFLLAEHFGGSGVLATVAAGMTMGNLGVLAERGRGLHLSPRGRQFVVAFWDFGAFLANSYIFLMIGLALADVRALVSPALLVTVLLALLGRAAAVYPLSRALRNTKWRISLAEQHFLWWAGLRGALALALALSLPSDTPYREQILIAAFAVVAFSALVQGLTAGFALKILGLDRKVETQAAP